ncbi:MAG: hypothetical protein MHM6MM_006030 [Cercozoa sp. M6MM]
MPRDAPALRLRSKLDDFQKQLDARRQLHEQGKLFDLSEQEKGDFTAEMMARFLDELDTEERAALLGDDGLVQRMMRASGRQFRADAAVQNAEAEAQLEADEAAVFADSQDEISMAQMVDKEVASLMERRLEAAKNIDDGALLAAVQTRLKDIQLEDLAEYFGAEGMMDQQGSRGMESENLVNENEFLRSLGLHRDMSPREMQKFSEQVFVRHRPRQMLHHLLREFQFDADLGAAHESRLAMAPELPSLADHELRRWLDGTAVDDKYASEGRGSDLHQSSQLRRPSRPHDLLAREYSSIRERVERVPATLRALMERRLERLRHTPDYARAELPAEDSEEELRIAEESETVGYADGLYHAMQQDYRAQLHLVSDKAFDERIEALLAADGDTSKLRASSVDPKVDAVLHETSGDLLTRMLTQVPATLEVPRSALHVNNATLKDAVSALDDATSLQPTQELLDALVFTTQVERKSPGSLLRVQQRLRQLEREASQRVASQRFRQLRNAELDEASAAELEAKEAEFSGRKVRDMPAPVLAAEHRRMIEQVLDEQSDASELRRHRDAHTLCQTVDIDPIEIIALAESMSMGDEVLQHKAAEVHPLASSEHSVEVLLGQPEQVHGLLMLPETRGFLNLPRPVRRALLDNWRPLAQRRGIAAGPAPRLRVYPSAGTVSQEAGSKASPLHSLQFVSERPTELSMTAAPDGMRYDTRETELAARMLMARMREARARDAQFLDNASVADVGGMTAAYTRAIRRRLVQQRQSRDADAALASAASENRVRLREATRFAYALFPGDENEALRTALVMRMRQRLHDMEHGTQQEQESDARIERLVRHNAGGSVGAPQQLFNVQSATSGVRPM